MTVDDPCPEVTPDDAETMWRKLQKLNPSSRGMLLELIYALNENRVTIAQFDRWWSDRGGWTERNRDLEVIAECTVWLAERRR